MASGRRGPYLKRLYKDESTDDENCDELYERPNKTFDRKDIQISAEKKVKGFGIESPLKPTQTTSAVTCFENTDRNTESDQKPTEESYYIHDDDDENFVEDKEEIPDTEDNFITEDDGNEIDGDIKTYYDENEISDVDSDSVILDNLPDIELNAFEFESDGIIDDDSDCDENEFLNQDSDSQQLYEGATVTVGAMMLLLALFFTKHNISGEGIQELLNIISIALPTEHRLCNSLSAYKNFFKNLKNPIVKHYFCGHCLGLIVERSSGTCPYSSCGKHLKDDPDYFLEMPIEDQIRSLFSQEGFYTSMQGRFNHNRNNTYSDIYDGTLYKSYSENGGPLSCPDNISFTFNTDGASVFRSSNVSVWPLFLVINELPYEMRMKKENMILAGLWFGSKKPYMGTFFQPFLEKFKQFEQGFDVSSPERGNFLTKAYMLCGTADLPARCLICNGVQFNGSFSCWKCMQSGKTAPVGKGHCHVFPFDEINPKGPPRTRESVLNDSKKALDQQEAGCKKYLVNGIKGPSWLTFFPLFNMVDGIAIDYMHGVLLGVQKMFLNLWFSAAHKGKPFIFYNLVCEADRRLLSLKPTLNISRLPRSIQSDLKYWKASEFRSFLLYYGAPILYGILDKERFQHYLYFVNAIHILLKTGTTEEDITSAELMLFEFVKQFAYLYDQCYMTLNFHQLVHLADSVRTLGPLFTHSCFSFEDKNGILLKMIRGTQNIDNQIITGVSFLQKLPELKRNTIFRGTELEKLYNSIEFPNVLTRGIKIAENMYVLGTVHSRVPSQAEHLALCTCVGFDPLMNDNVNHFKRLEFGKDLIYGTSYTRMIKRDNSTISYSDALEFDPLVNDEMFGRVQDFLIVDVNQDLKKNVFVVVAKLNRKQQSSHSCLVAVEQTNEITVIPLSHVLESCMFISYRSTSDIQMCYVCKFPNRLESD